MLPGCWLSVSTYHGHSAQRPPVIKKGFQKGHVQQYYSWEHTTEEKRPVLWHHARHWLCYNEVQQCTVCVWEGQHTKRACSLSVALCKPVSQSDLSMFKHTLPQGDIRGLTGVRSSVVTQLLFLCCGQPWAVLPHSWEAQSAAPIRWP